MRRSGFLRCLAPAILAAAACVGSPTAAAETGEATLAATLLRAEAELRDGETEAAAALFREARRLAAGPCPRCSVGLSTVHARLGEHDEAVAEARRAMTEASEPPDRIAALNQLGISLFAGGTAEAERLEEAAEAFGQVLELTSGAANVARYNQAEALVRLDRGAEALPLLEEYLRSEPEGAHAPRVRFLVTSLSRPGPVRIPDFEVVTVAGEPLTAADLRGKVALLDFWGTWCLPCLKALPELKRLQRRLRDRPFVLLSISSDSREQTLLDFIDRHEMTWPQVWDRGGRLQWIFGVESYPTYILVDPEGVEIYRLSGWSPALGLQLEERVVAAVEAAAAARAAPASSGG